MKARLADWWDRRTGCRGLIQAVCAERIPGGAKWRHTLGSLLVALFLVQGVTGLLLMLSYSPGESTAWASVFYTQYEMDFGWLIRGLHQFSSQAMVVVGCLYLLEMVLFGGHLPPREVSWWIGLCLLGLILAGGLTGYLLPWDQKGYWATQVRTSIVGGLPVVGPWLQKQFVGGASYGHLTLTRFYTLHVGVLPPLFALLLIAMGVIRRRHGVAVSKNVAGEEGVFWPDQAFRNLVVSIVVLLALVGVSIVGQAYGIRDTPASDAAVVVENQPATPTSWWERIAHAGRDGAGAQLDAPADPGRPYPARPEWYFLFLFQFLKYFTGEQEIVGTILVPIGVALALFILPLLGYGPRWARAVGHAFGVLVVLALFAGMGELTYLANAEDRAQTEQAKLFRQECVDAEALARRAIQLASTGIPPGGAVQLLRRDPVTQGEALYGKHCASCHNYGKTFTDGKEASDLKGFGTQGWILGLLKDPGHETYFGHTELDTMADYAEEELSDLGDEEQAELRVVAKWLASHPRKTSNDVDSESFKAGMTAFLETFECVKCHAYEEHKSRRPGPNFTGYGDADWIRGMLMAPDHSSRYGKKNAMPIFIDLEGPDSEIVRQNAQKRHGTLTHLAPVQRELILRWLTKDPRPVFGGQSIYSP